MKELPEERDIDVRQLLLTILLRWKVLLLLCLIGAVLGGGYAVVRNRRSAAQEAVQEVSTELSAEEVAEQEAALQQYREDLERYQSEKAQLEEAIEGAQERLQQQEDYIANSLLRRIDPYHVVTTTGGMELRLRADQAASDALNLPALAQLYQTYLSSDEAMGAAAGKVHSEAVYVREVVEVSLREGTPVISISVIGDTAKQNTGILQALFEQAEQYREELEPTYRGYELVTWENAPVTAVNQTLIQGTDTINTSVNIASAQLASINNALNQLREPAAPVMEDTEPAEQAVAPARVSKVKYAALGAIGFLLAGIFCFLCYYIISGKVLSADEMNKRYGLRPLTVISEKEASGVARRILLAGRDGSFHRMSRDDRMQTALANLSVYDPEAKEFLLTGSVETSRLQQVRDALQAVMQDVKVSCAPDINENAASLQMLKEHEHIILVEQVLASGYDEINREMQTLRDWNKKVIGSIVMT